MEKELIDKIRTLEQRIRELEGRRTKKSILGRLQTFVQISFQKSNIVFGVFVTALFFTGMLYALTKPYTFNPGDPASASQVNANFDALYDHMNDGVMVGLSATQSIAMSNSEFVAFDTILSGNSPYLNAGTNEISIQDVGIYRFSYFVHDTNMAYCSEYIYYNGSETKWENHHVKEFNTGDTISLFLDCTSMAANIVPSDATGDTFMMVERIW